VLSVWNAGIRIFHDVAMKLVHMPSRQAVRAAIAASLQHNGAPLRSTASHLGVSARSLQRHLAMMGTSYSEILAEVRLDTACRLLIETDEQISRIALSLGYAGASSFSRTFMRMMKVQPGSYRRQNGSRRQTAKARA
jgi:AraC-like DNA-binding protein